MAKKSTEQDAGPTKVSLSKGDVTVETTIPGEVAELKANGFTVDTGTKTNAPSTSGASASSDSSRTSRTSSTSSGTSDS
ncbi:hypothetical protein [Tersicoccus sp. Bi-70]|uniref:hypothetical protein n=1 Tax=Tersicoccus sp. Bi-70 TaxID=1897634 RepID=UPI0009753F19|nr:hypothetical protein [Tersicoccus sp. Bi-70]OMH30654.1 hypothetical protein BGP79_11895 [Tersicoccus sp. Bi-70]